MIKFNWTTSLWFKRTRFRAQMGLEPELEIPSITFNNSNFEPNFTMETNKTMQKLHVRNIFQLFVPISSNIKYDVALSTIPSFGFTLTQQNAPEFCYHYQIQLFANDKNMQGEVVETEAVDCFSWAKRNPFIIHSYPEDAGITLRMKIDHGTFDFRKIKKRPIKIYVTCFSAGVFLQRGYSKICKLLPKKRHTEYSTVDSEGNAIIVNARNQIHNFRSLITRNRL